MVMERTVWILVMLAIIIQQRLSIFVEPVKKTSRIPI